MKPRDLAIALGVMLIWGLNLVVAKPTVMQLPPIFAMALRFAIAAAVMLPFVRLPRRHWLQIALLAFTLGTVHYALMFTGLRGVDASAAGLLTQAQVPFSSLLAWLVFKERLGYLRAGGMVAAIIGVAFIAGEPRTASDPWSVILILLGTMLWSATNIQVKRLAGLDGITIMAWMSLFAVPQLLAVSFVLESGHVAAVQAADWRAWFGAFYMGVVVAALSYILWLRLIQSYPINAVMPITLLGPVITVAAGIILLDEPITWQRLLGGARLTLPDWPVKTISPGGVAGAFVQYDLTPRWSIRTELTGKLLDRNLQRTESSVLLDEFGASVKVDQQANSTGLLFVEIPILVVLRQGRHEYFAGPKLALVSVRNDGTRLTYTGNAFTEVTQYNIQDGIRRLDAGVTLGYGYQLHRHWVMDVRYNQGLLDLTHDNFFNNSQTLINSDLQLTFRYVF